MSVIAGAAVVVAVLAGCSGADPAPAPVAVVTEQVVVPVPRPVQQPEGYAPRNVPVAPPPQPQQGQPIVTVPRLESQQGIDLGIDEGQAALERQQEELERQQEWQQQEMERQQRALKAQLEEQQEQLECMQSDLEGGIALGC